MASPPTGPERYSTAGLCNQHRLSLSWSFYQDVHEASWRDRVCCPVHVIRWLRRCRTHLPFSGATGEPAGLRYRTTRTDSHEAIGNWGSTFEDGKPTGPWRSTSADRLSLGDHYCRDIYRTPTFASELGMRTVLCGSIGYGMSPLSKVQSCVQCSQVRELKVGVRCQNQRLFVGFVGLHWDWR